MYKTVEIGLKPQINKKQTNKGFYEINQLIHVTSPDEKTSWFGNIWPGLISSTKLVRQQTFGNKNRFISLSEYWYTAEKYNVVQDFYCSCSEV